MKPWWKSKTFWFNAVTGTLEIVNLLNGSAIPAAVALPVITVGNIILRFISKDQVTVK